MTHSLPTRRPSDRNRRNVETGVERKLFDAVGRAITTMPDDLDAHKTLRRVIEGRAEMFKTGENFDWATGEALAFGTLLSEGYQVRLSGQDSGRGTFSQRHAVWVDQTTEAKYVPLKTLPHGRFEVLDRSEEHTSELQSLMRISYAVFCLKKKN